jgi:hypothetical protein
MNYLQEIKATISRGIAPGLRMRAHDDVARAKARNAQPMKAELIAILRRLTEVAA